MEEKFILSWRVSNFTKNEEENALKTNRDRKRGKFAREKRGREGGSFLRDVKIPRS